MPIEPILTGYKPRTTANAADRKIRMFNSKKSGLATLMIEGDSVSVKTMFDHIRERSNTLYNDDGGRDIDTGKHARSHDQRNFDAAHELIANITTNPDGRTKQQPRQPGRGTAKPQIFVGITLDKYLGAASRELAEQIGLGLIADSMLASYLEHADIIAVLYDQNGQPLWLHRAKRHANLMQRYALIARDKACVLCRAPHAQYDIHHRTPWTAPTKGETNLDNLVLLCRSCHQQLHTNNHTIYQNHNHTGRTRPATPNETPAKPARERNQPRQE